MTSRREIRRRKRSRMLDHLLAMLRKAPLLAAILLLWLLLTILSVAGRRGAYRNYSTDHGRLPGLSLVMQGIHDHVMPWSQAPGGEKADAAKGDRAELAGSAAGTGSGGAEQDAAGAAAPVSGENAAYADGFIETPGKDPEKAETDGGSSDDSGSKEKGAGSSAGQTAGTGGKEKNTAADKPQAGALQIPETSCSRVVQAKDYGVAEKGYLSPDDTVYNTDTEGLFAPNGIYYSLQEVEDSYFSDALFVGDSRTVGLYEYGDMGPVTSFLARESTSVYDLFDDEKMEYAPRGKEPTERTLKDLLSKAKFRKIYLSVGVNELGVPDTEDYYREYRKVIEKIHKLQPEAVIYIQGIMHVSKAMSSTDGVYNNTAIVQRNEAIATLANGRSIFYIDMNEDLCDENGDLKADLTGDGIHLKASACALWHDYLLRHAAVVPD